MPSCHQWCPSWCKRSSRWRTKAFWIFASNSLVTAISIIWSVFMCLLMHTIFSNSHKSAQHIVICGTSSSHCTSSVVVIIIIGCSFSSHVKHVSLWLDSLLLKDESLLSRSSCWVVEPHKHQSFIIQFFENTTWFQPQKGVLINSTRASLLRQISAISLRMLKLDYSRQSLRIKHCYSPHRTTPQYRHAIMGAPTAGSASTTGR